MAFSSSESGAMSRPASGIVSPQQKSRSRAQSISSDRPSTIGHGMMSPPVSVSPEAAFIAASAASQIVTNDHDNHANTWYDQHGIEPSGETALVSNAALQLVNNFLDQLLFNFLSLARSTSLSSLRPAVTEVLKPKLAKDAINQADEELREYLGGGDDEDMLQSQMPDSPKDWDLELVWKRTRLRCMVYSSLGDMEEEDEDFYMEQEHLDGGDEALGETVSPAVAIFLTSILEFMGEQALISAGQAAYHRMRFISEKERKDVSPTSPASVADRITVEEVDMERVAFDRTIGRLWRAWKKRIRSPVTDVHAFQQRSFSHDFGRQSSHIRQASQDETTIAEAISESGETKDAGVMKENPKAAKIAYENPDGTQEPGDHQPEATPPVQRDEEEWLSVAVSAPLPVDDNDVIEILLPGLVYYSDEEEDDVLSNEKDSSAKRKRKAGKEDAHRPKSLMIFPHTVMAGLPTPTTSEPSTPDMPYTRKRANSLPTPSISPYSSPARNRAGLSEEERELEEGSSPSEIDGERNEPASEQSNKDESAMLPAPLAVRQKKRPAVPLQTQIIGAAITTASPRAIPMSSMNDESGSDREEDGDEEIDEFTEEPEIMTSSRVSISGRSNSPTVSEHGRPISMSPSLPVRSPSVHSLRVIDVTGPRSPVSRSRGSSVDAHDPVSGNRVGNASRTSSISAQPIAEEGSSGSAAGPRSSYMSTKMSRTYTSESISEAEEAAAKTKKGSAQQVKNAASPVSESPRSVKRFEELQSQLQTSQHIFGSVTRHTAASPSSPMQSPLHPPPPPVSKTPGAPTKVTILSSTTSSGSFFIDDKSDVPVKPQSTEAAQSERSARRQGSTGPAAAVAAAAAVGAVAAAAGSTSPRRELPPSPRVTERSSSSSTREQQARGESRAEAQARVQAQTRAEAEAASRQQSHTSASSTSSSTSKLKPKRASEESTVMRPEDVARNFEELIQSDQTIQYTLTPENMRDMDSTRSIHDGSSIVVRSRKSEDARQNGDRSRSSSINNRTEGKRSASISRTNTFDSRSTETPNGKLSGPVPRSPRSVAPSVSSASKPRGPAPQAREARVAQESLADFAEFIRGTGPSGKVEEPPASRGGAPVRGSVSNAIRSMDSGRTSSTTSRQKYQARDAAVDYKDDNSDLIDFIRRGPPSAGGNPRIPRTVAPFRTTMDSDQMAGAVGGRAVDATIPDLRYSAASTNVTESSMGSSTGLLKKENKTSPRIGGRSSNGNMFDSPNDGMPKRKTRRVKDPYAIDFSDEEDDFDEPPRGGRRAPPAKEESLLDFLSSVPPPVDTNPVLFDIPQTRNLQQTGPRKKASAPSLMSRFGRNNSTSGNTSPRGGVPNGSSSIGGDAGFSARTDSRSLSSRAGSTMSGRGRGYIPIQVNMPPALDKYSTSAAASSASASSGSRPVAASAGSGRRVPMKKFEPREAQSVSSRATQDLADFFRNSGPPQSFRG